LSIFHSLYEVAANILLRAAQSSESIANPSFHMPKKVLHSNEKRLTALSIKVGLVNAHNLDGHSGSASKKSSLKMQKE
jgi:hypothetical protein